MSVSQRAVQNAKETLEQLDQKISHFEELISLANWDLQTGAPKKGRALRSKAVGTLSSEVFQLSLSKEMGECLDTLSQPEAQAQLDMVTRAKVREYKRNYDRSRKIPPEEYKEYVVLTSQAQDIWVEARQKKDFSLFRDTLKKIVDFKKKFIDYYGFEEHPYDALLDEYEPGLTVKTLDQLFGDLRAKTTELLARIQDSANKPRTDIFQQSFDIKQQEAFSRFVLSKLGYDLDAGRLDVSAHPFAVGINTKDVRITTRYMENDMRSAIFGTIHECGHALYEQGVNPKFEGTVLRGGTSMGIHESQSRFLENMVGRSFEFWTYFYEDLKRFFPDQFNDVSIEEFCRAINTVEPSLIRVEADELTYNLHIMIRYEIEKGLMSGELEVDDLPSIWNQKMEEYLGLTPPDDAQGVLQDIHCSFGGFGYFPSYSLGNLYAAQILYTIRKEMPDFYDKIRNGDFLPIREWLRENIHQYGKLYTPQELIKKVTGEDLNAKYLIDYFEEKYSKVYQL
ncbi:carboxypeptidase M32 [Caldalkalibacillus thermarum TA2.A1]|uniref:Metal-dependent carboxypeptidase n=1 Tax=Caldalkalibacillus thermarum (strain TA2.A1) TaxID=986075 RepID=A0A8X8I7D0_CALTT|nr:carboxypeptidase M32 [Caldalkalibacillus thermarum]QZT32788.1 carboxypeptidase M32 [Caldalkalibacillus thermarum TA2.A1]